MQEGEKTGSYLQYIKGHSNWHTVKNKMHKILITQQSRALRAYILQQQHISSLYLETQ